jgi:cell division initiation protein
LKITPIEINKQEFKKSLRGYEPVEVDTFLEMVGKEYEKILDQNVKYQKRIIELETELKNYKEVESTLKQTLMSVQETSDKSLENTKKEMELLRKESELKANKMIEDAKRETQKLKEELITLQTQKHSLVARLRHILTSHIELLDVLDIDDFDISKLKDRTKKVFSSSKAAVKKNSKLESVDQNSGTHEESDMDNSDSIDYDIDDLKKND